MAETILAKMAVQIAANTAEFNKSLNNTSAGIKTFQSNITRMAGAIGVAFGVKEVAQFAFEISKLAGEADGVKAAFDRLPGSTKLMLDLREATHGTVSEMELMKRSVQAANFGISLESLPKLLQFAALRAQQTGQSVDYLVDSIITGIGRKSPLILDNLGISAIALKDKMNGVAVATASVGEVADAVGKIAEDNLKTMGEFSDNTSSKVESLAASWENFKVALGRTANESGILQTALKGLTDVFNFFGGQVDKLTRGQLNAALIKLQKIRETSNNAEEIAWATRAIAELSDAYGLIKVRPLEEVNEEVVKQVVNLETLQAKLKDLNTQFELTDETDKKKLSNIGREILATKDLINTLEEYRKKQEQIGEFQTKFGREGSKFVEPKETRPDSANILGPLPVGDPNVNPGPNPALENERKEIDFTLETWQEFYAIKRQLADEDAARMLENAQVAADYGTAIGESLGSAISGQKKFSDAMRQLTGDLIKMFLQRALAGIISSAATAGGPPPVAIALAAAGVAAISAMFSKIGASGGGGGGGGGGLRSAQSATRNERVADQFRIAFDAKFVLEGTSLVALVDRQNKIDGRINGGG